MTPEPLDVYLDLDGIYVATCPSQPQVRAFGASRAQAEQAAQEQLASLQSSPAPRSTPTPEPLLAPLSWLLGGQ